MSMSADPRPSDLVSGASDASEAWTRPAGAAAVVPIRADALPADPADALEQAIAVASRRIAPLWPLRNFVAVNAFMGFTELPYADAVREVDRLLHGSALMPLSFYREQHRSGRIRGRDLRDALAGAAETLARPELADADPAELLATLLAGAEGGAPRARVETLAEAVDRSESGSWNTLVVHEISKWCAGRYDLGQAAWKQPWRELAPYPAWREAARIDRNPELRGLTGFRDYVARLPEEPFEAIAAVLEQLGVPESLHADLLTRELASIGGWAGHVQWQVREAELTGGSDDSLVHLLAIRLAFDGALDHALGGCGHLLWPRLRSLPEERDRRAHPRDRRPHREGGPGEAGLDAWEQRVVWQLAYEAGYRGRLLPRLAGHAAKAPARSGLRPALQAVFCIDVRSEVLRRHLEAQSDAIQTVGFAGFFGFPVEYVNAGDERGAARCPVLIAPERRVREEARDGSDAVARSRRARERHERFSAVRKLSVGAYPLVETLGHLFGLRLLSDSLGWTRIHEGGALFGDRAAERLAPSVEAGADEGFGLALEERIDLAEGALRNMGLTEGFGEVVLLCGHGSLSSNNPYASGLDCGACGGHRGDGNARIAAAVLGSPEVRAGLAARGIRIPADTRFVAGLHDTTRDVVELLDAEDLPAELRDRIEAWLDDACTATRDERAPRLGSDAGRRLGRRARDWSEVRPEWGLAGNAAFVAARRDRTRGLDLGGRAFLHDYDPDADPEGSVLELILTAPLVVASWINLQYYASTTDNERFGSGDKTLHNVVGRLGVQLGNRSDLQVGLPWQSVHDGEGLAHEPMRLTAIVEAPRSRIEAVLDGHADVRRSLENGWIHLIAWDPEAGSFHRFQGGDEPWQPVSLDA